MTRRHTNADRKRAHAAGQRNIRRRCICGRTITGNAGWWSHTHYSTGAERPDHYYIGRAGHHADHI